MVFCDLMLTIIGSSHMLMDRMIFAYILLLDRTDAAAVQTNVNQLNAKAALDEIESGIVLKM
jgi:hypothetical protein